jgi:hypothetical protein
LFCYEIQFDHSLNKPFIMKTVFLAHVFVAGSLLTYNVNGQSTSAGGDGGAGGKHLFLDVHQLDAAKVTGKDVAAAHQKDLKVEGKYDVNIIKYWYDQKDGRVYCLASAPNAESLIKTHAEAHGLVPEQVYAVTAGQEAALRGKKNLYLDIHYLEAGKVTAKDVAGAHQKDLAVQKKYGVNLVNYWVDEKEGIVMCLAQAKDSMDLIKTHKEAHGLLPARVMKVKDGN